MLDAAAYRFTRHSIPSANLRQGPLACGVEAHGFRRFCICQFAHAMAFPTRHALWMGICAIVFSMCHTFRMQTSRMIVTPQDAFRMCQVPLASLCDHIIHVVLMRPRKEVRRVAAESRVAPVQHKQAVWRPCSRREKPTHDMGTHVAGFMRGSAKVPVAVRMAGTLPQPAITPWPMSWRFIHLGPKAVDKGVNRCTSGRVVTRRTTVDFGIPRGNVEGLATGSICTGNSRMCHQTASLYGRDDVWTRPPRHKETRSFPADQAT